MRARRPWAGAKRRARHCRETLRRICAIQRVAGILDAVHRSGERTRIVLPGAPRRGGRRIAWPARGESDAAKEKELREAAGGNRWRKRKLHTAREERHFARSEALKKKT